MKYSWSILTSPFRPSCTIRIASACVVLSEARFTLWTQLLLYGFWCILLKCCSWHAMATLALSSSLWTSIADTYLPAVSEYPKGYRFVRDSYTSYLIFASYLKCHSGMSWPFRVSHLYYESQYGNHVFYLLAVSQWLKSYDYARVNCTRSVRFTLA